MLVLFLLCKERALKALTCTKPDHTQVRGMMKTLRAERPIPGKLYAKLLVVNQCLEKIFSDVIQIMKEEGVDHIQMKH